MSRDEKLKRARRAARDERVLKPLLALAILAIAVAAFLGLVSPELALAVILAPALAGLAYPTSRRAPSYAELVELLAAESAQQPSDPLVDALSRKA